MVLQRILREKDEKREFFFRRILSKRLADYPDVLTEII